MGRSKTRRSAGDRSPAAPSFAPLVSPQATEGVLFEPLTERAEEARRLFSYVGAWAPPLSKGEVAWGASVGREADQQLIGALLLEKKGAAGMLYGPVVILTAGAGWNPIEVAAGLVAALVPQATGSGIETLFARPQGLDRVWVRFGFIPVPAADLPQAFKGRPGTGLFAWRGGTALWSTRKPPGSPLPSPSRGRGSELSPRPPHPTHNPLTFILSPSRGRGQGEGGEEKR